MPPPGQRNRQETRAAYTYRGRKPSNHPQFPVCHRFGQEDKWPHKTAAYILWRESAQASPVTADTSHSEQTVLQLFYQYSGACAPRDASLHSNREYQ